MIGQRPSRLLDALKKHERKYFAHDAGLGIGDEDMTTQHTPPEHEDLTKKKQPGQPGQHEEKGDEKESDPSKKTPNEGPGTQQPHRT
jgi:hypothetical protein